jgi:hypothetical protein
MFGRSAPFDWECDAPSYNIVQACQRLGFYAPEDVRWCRLSHLGQHRVDWREFLRRPWRLLQGLTRSTGKTCFCGQALPGLEMCTFTLISGKEISYVMGQCRRCHAIFWDESSVAIGEKGQVL